MHFDAAFSYLNCQSCSAKIHCEECAANLEDRLRLRPGIASACIDIKSGRICIDAAMDEDDLLDLLEEIGIFAD